MSEQADQAAPAATSIPEAPLPVLDVEANSSSTTVARIEEDEGGSISAFASAKNYETARKMAAALAASGIVPAAYQGKPANCIVAMELAGRTGASVFAVMQNLHIIQGKPSFSSAFLIGSVNSCGRFSPIRFEEQGTTGKAGWRVRAIARDLKTGDTLEGIWVTWEMANAEGWTSKAGSKWKTMPDLMIRYRAAAFWTRLFAPEISLGMHTSDEVDDFVGPVGPTPGATELNRVLDAAAAPAKGPAKASATVAPVPGTATVLYPFSKYPDKCDVCFRTDGTHDPDAPCADLAVDAEIATADAR